MIHRLLSICLVIAFTCAIGLPPINIFRPSDKFLIPPKAWCSNFQFTFAYEGALSVKGVLADDLDCLSWSERKVNPLQLYQLRQDGIAMLKGFGPTTNTGQLAQLFFENDDNGTHGHYIPCGDFKVPVNAMFSARWHFNHAITFAAYIQYLVMELEHVRFNEIHTNTSFEDLIAPDLFSTACTVGNLDLGGWKRKGFGDLVLQAYWQQDYPQYRPWLRNVAPMVRLGIDCPTGKKADVDKLLAIPFGNDGSWGVQLSGGLDLYFGCHLKAGFDIELLYLFGHERPARFRTDLGQTDLLFMRKLPAFKENGLTQQYYLYAQIYDCYGFAGGIHFQQLKQNESRLYVCSDKFDPIIINDAESLQEWSINSLIFTLTYDFSRFCQPNGYKPYISCWYKQGLMGERALMANTLGATFTLSF